MTVADLRTEQTKRMTLSTVGELPHILYLGSVALVSSSIRLDMAVVSALEHCKQTQGERERSVRGQ